MKKLSRPRYGLLIALLSAMVVLASCSSTGTPSNSAPTADAGSDRTASLGETVVLDGSNSSDPDGDPLSFAWRFVAMPDGSAATLANAKTATPSFTPDTVGIYDLELTATDGTAAATDRVQVTVIEAEPFTYTIDPSIAPVVDSYPRPGGGDAPVAAIRVQDGRTVSFVANEVVIRTDDEAALQAFLALYQGEILQQTDPSGAGLDLLPSYLIRVEPGTADLSAFEADMRAVSEQGDVMGELAFSSETGAGLMAIATASMRSGLGAGISWLGQPDDIAAGESLEAPQPGTFTQDAFLWPHFSATSTQGIGVGEAWQVLERAGRLDNSVKIAILDGGFCPADPLVGWTNSDYPESLTGYDSVIGAVTNFSSCYFSSPFAGWHGTHVFGAAMGAHDNLYGTTGPAAPIGVPILVEVLYDPWTTEAGLIAARTLGAKIASMSYHWEVPYGLGWTVSIGLEAVTIALKNSGMLLFASAGNARENVDDETCIGFMAFDECVGYYDEPWLYVPCEISSVICVGGIERDGIARAVTSSDSGSNFGPDDVELSGPYTVPEGPDPDDTLNRLQTINGTSFSTPFVAGVAALIWAADPALSWQEVRQILYDTARPASYGDDMERGYACALCAVRDLIPNTAPRVTIQAPLDGATYEEASFVAFEATASDLEQNLVIEWSEDGQRLENGFGETFGTNGLCPGDHTVTASVVDEAGLSASDDVTVTVEDAVPTVDITTDPPPTEIGEGDYLPLSGKALDRTCTDPTGASTNQARLQWTVEDGNDGSGSSHLARFTSQGAKTVTLSYTDDGGLTGTAALDVQVNPPPVGGYPTRVLISSPPPPSVTFFGTETSWATCATQNCNEIDIHLAGEAADGDYGYLSGDQLVWEMREQGASSWQVVGQGNTATARIPFEQLATYEFRLVATDPNNPDDAPGVETVTVTTEILL